MRDISALIKLRHFWRSSSFFPWSAAVASKRRTYGGGLRTLSHPKKL